MEHIHIMDIYIFLRYDEIYTCIQYMVRYTRIYDEIFFFLKYD